MENNNTQSITLPVSKEFHALFIYILNHLDLDHAFFVVRKEELEDARRYVAYDEEGMKDEEPEFQEECRGWAERDIKKCDELLAKFVDGKEFIVGKYTYEDGEQGEKYEGEFIEAFEKESDANDHWDFLNFNEAMARTEKQMKEGNKAE